MRAVRTSTALGAFARTPEASAGAPLDVSPPGHAAKNAPASPFAAALAARLVASTPSAGTTTTPDEDASEPDDGRDDAAVPPTAPAATPNTTVAPAPASNALASLLAGARPAASSAASSADVRHVSRDTNALSPALRERLGRVVARMQREYGHDVRVAETGRTQARQDYLYAQGRTRSGPVVTWTRDSAHTRGRAVDVTIDGGYDDPTAFARLQQIAQAEGLRTLGARDPGHLELPRDVPGDVPALDIGEGAARVTVESFGVRTESAAPQPSSAATPSLTPSGVASVAEVASVASVAPVASVANIATVASVAAPAAGTLVHPTAPAPAARAQTVGGARDAVGDDSRNDSRNDSRDTAAEVPRARAVHGRDARGRDARNAVAAPSATPGAVGEARDGARGSDEHGPRDGKHTRDDGADARDEQTASPRVDAGSATNAGATVPAVVAGDTTATASGGTPLAPGPMASAAPAPAPSGAAPVLGAIAAERIARVLDAQQASAPRTVSHLSLRVERADGGEDRIRLDLRGRSVDARIDIADLSTADQLAARTPELRAALAQHGLTTDDVRVRAGSVDRGADAGVPSVPTLGAGAGRADANAFSASAHQPGDGSARDQASDGSSRDSGRQNERQSDNGASDRGPGDPGAERQAGDRRQGRRPPPDAYLDTITSRAVRRS